MLKYFVRLKKKDIQVMLWSLKQYEMWFYIKIDNIFKYTWKGLQHKLSLEQLQLGRALTTKSHW